LYFIRFYYFLSIHSFLYRDGQAPNEAPEDSAVGQCQYHQFSAQIPGIPHRGCIFCHFAEPSSLEKFFAPQFFENFGEDLKI